MLLARLRRPLALLAVALAFLLAPVASYAAPVAAPLHATAVRAGVRILKAPGTVKAGRIATVSVKTDPRASCSITVLYKSGPGHAAGLVPHKANAAGVALWSWRVGGNTTSGRWPVVISCAGQGTARTSVSVYH